MNRPKSKKEFNQVMSFYSTLYGNEKKTNNTSKSREEKTNEPTLEDIFGISTSDTDCNFDVMLESVPDLDCGVIEKLNETQIQTKVSSWLSKKGYVFYHPANEGYRSSTERFKIKRMGTFSGIPDLLVFSKPSKRTTCGLALELKSAKGELTENQVRWLKKLSELGWSVAVAYSYEEAIGILENLGY